MGPDYWKKYHKCWVIRRSVDRSKKRNVGQQEFLSYISPSGELVFTRYVGEILIFSSQAHAKRYASSGSGLTIDRYSNIDRFSGLDFVSEATRQRNAEAWQSFQNWRQQQTQG